MRRAPFRRVIWAISMALFAAPLTFAVGASADQSGTWTTLANPSGDQFISGISCYSISNSDAISAYDNSVYVTGNLGQSWSTGHTQKSVGLQGTITCRTGGTCFELGAVEDSGRKFDGVTIAKSSDGGSDWKVVYKSLIPPEAGVQPTYQLD